VVTAVDIDNGAAVGNHISLETPFPSQLILQQEFTCARRLAVDALYAHITEPALPSTIAARKAGS
jgi:hypothetical protein